MDLPGERKFTWKCGEFCISFWTILWTVALLDDGIRVHSLCSSKWSQVTYFSICKRNILCIEIVVLVTFTKTLGLFVLMKYLCIYSACLPACMYVYMYVCSSVLRLSVCQFVCPQTVTLHVTLYINRTLHSYLVCVFFELCTLCRLLWLTYDLQLLTWMTRPGA